jgi:hypothetical protein
LTGYVTVYTILIVTAGSPTRQGDIMHSLNFFAAREHGHDLRRAAVAQTALDSGQSPVTRVTLRYAAAADSPRLRELAELDSAVAPGGPMLVAEIDGRVRAALPLDGGAPIADPFHRGTELIELLRVRAAHLAR